MKKPVIQRLDLSKLRKPDLSKLRKTVIPSKPRTPLVVLADAEDPIDESKNPGDPEGDASVELSQVRTGFMKRAKQEAERFRTATSTDYYTIVVFDDGAQCTAFLKAVGMNNERSGDLYLDGRVLAERLDIKLPEAKTVFNASPRIDAKLKALVRSKK